MSSKSLRNLLFFITLPRVITSLNVLFYILLLGKSHIDFTDSLIDTLVENGHTVDLIIARMNSHVKTNGTERAARKYVYGFTEDSPWSKTPHLVDPFLPRTRTWKEHTHYMSIATEICEIGLSDPNLHKFIQGRKYDIGISTEYDYCGFAMMKHYSIPSIVSVSSMAVLDQQSISAGMSNSAAVTSAAFETENLSTLWGKFKNLVNWAHINFIVYPYCQRMQAKIINRYLGDHIKMDDLISEIDLAFVNSNEIIETPRELPPKIKYIGGINLRKPKKLDEDTERMISARNTRGLVIFCFGTQVPSSLFPLEVRKSFAAAFQRFPQYTFLWKYEEQEGDRQIFSNVTNLRMMKWLPQNDLLNDPRTVAFISHVGLNSYVEASYAGIPILAVPLFVDQPHNAQSGQSIGTTFVLDKTKLTTANIVKGLEAVLDDSSYSLNAKRISKMLRERPQSADKIFIEWVEFAARNPLLHRNLNLAGQKLDFFSYYCLDVLTVFTAVLGLSIFVIFRGIRGVLRVAKRVKIVEKVKNQ